jgi:hypothetical protein
MLYLFFLYNLTQQPAERGRPVFFIVFKLQRFSQPWLPTLYMVPGSEMVRLDQVARVRPPRPKPLPSPETETGAGAARRRATVSLERSRPLIPSQLAVVIPSPDAGPSRRPRRSQPPSHAAPQC